MDKLKQKADDKFWFCRSFVISQLTTIISTIIKLCNGSNTFKALKDHYCFVSLAILSINSFNVLRARKLKKRGIGDNRYKNLTCTLLEQ